MREITLPEQSYVVIADDDATTRKILEAYFRKLGISCRLAANGLEAIKYFGPDMQLAILDLRMPKMGGLECLSRLKQNCPEVPALMVSSAAEIPDAVVAIREGASDFLVKPVDPQSFEQRVRQLLVGSPSSQPPPPKKLVLDDLQYQLDVISGHDATVLLTGETGTGKTVLARQIHDRGARRNGPFVSINCAALPRELLEAELFGHAKGAFTGAISDRSGRIESAGGGTLFLDEIGDMPLELQPKLLTFLQDKHVQRIGSNTLLHADVRIIAATNQDLGALCQDKRFREDLFYRISVLNLYIQPLRERISQIEQISDAILSQIATRRGLPPFVLTDEARILIAHCPWPGNIRELENVLERAAAFANSQRISKEDLDFSLTSSLSNASSDSNDAGAGNLSWTPGMSLREVERLAILATLEACDDNQAKAARMLKISEKTIYNKLKSYRD